MYSTYLSGEDSLLLRKALKKYRGKKCVEIGIGYGSNLLDLSNYFEEIVGTDIIRTDGFKIGKDQRFDLFLCDRTTCFRDHVFEFVIANPPYLPSSRIEDESVDGGRDGFEVPRLFLEEALRVLTPNGTILVILSSETSFILFKQFCEENQLLMKQVESKTLFFETLTAYELQKKRS
jgi:methylase of polypeptide subunit release factors